MREGWKCPACSRINSPDITVCPCSEGGAAVPAAPVNPLGGGSSGAAGTAWPTVTTTWTDSAGNRGQGVTLTSGTGTILAP